MKARIKNEPNYGLTPTATLEAGPPGGGCVVKIGGDWRLSGVVPSWKSVVDGKAPGAARVAVENLGRWDSSLVLFLAHGRSWCAQSKQGLNTDDLPANLKVLLGQLPERGEPKPGRKAFVKPTWALAEAAAKKRGSKAREIVDFIGDCTLGFAGAVKEPRRFRWMDCLVEMQQCWVSSLPIVSLVSFLVGVILAFQAAIQLREFGAAILVADLVGLAVVREMGPMMAAIIVAGGTGAGFAAQLGNMKADEEIDALETLGVSPVNFLALPRLLAVTLMMPVLALYANVLGVLGGMFVSATMLRIPATAYWAETQNHLEPVDLASGLFKSLFFGALVGLAGCLRGMKCDPSAAGVGAATSSAVVTGMLLIVVTDALFAVIYNALGI